jgi:hypothetical protein
MTSTPRILPLLTGTALVVGGCGTYVPEIQENPWDQDRGQLLVQNIIDSIQCEVKDVITYVLNVDYDLSRLNNRPPLVSWLLGWGVQMQLTLTVDEKSVVSPSGVQSPSPIFFLGLGATLSSQATRIDTLNYYRLVGDIYYNPNYPFCYHNYLKNGSTGSFFFLIQSDLKLREWLLSIFTAKQGPEGDLLPSFTSNKQSGNNGFQHQVTFEVVTSGNISPMWKLVHATVNQSGPLFSISRDRKHDLIIGFGPNDPKTNSLQPAAAGTFLSSQIGVSNRSQLTTTGTIP